MYECTSVEVYCAGVGGITESPIILVHTARAEMLRSARHVSGFMHAKLESWSSGAAAFQSGA